MATNRKFNVRNGLSAGVGSNQKDVVDNDGKVLDLGDLSSLTTTDKTDVVSAINELNSGMSNLTGNHGDLLGLSDDDHTQYISTTVDRAGISANISTTGNLGGANLVLSGELQGPSSFVIDPATVGDNTGSVEIKGDVTIQGTTTTINSTTLDVAALTVTLADGAASAAAADGAGIVIDGASASLTYDSAGDTWVFNKTPYFGVNRLLTTADSIDADSLGGHGSDYFQDAATALTTATTFGGDVSGTYDDIIIADDSHNHIIDNVDGLQSALNAKLDASSESFLKADADDTASGLITFSGGVKVSSSNLTFDDDIKASWGDSGSDLQIYHNSTTGNSHILEGGSGKLVIGADADVEIKNTAGDEVKAKFTTDGAVELYHNNIKAIETTDTGIDVSLGTITGPATLNIDPAAVGDNTGLVVIKGDLQVDGTTTTINSTTVTVNDLNITLASGAANSAAADGAGITIDGANETFTYEDSNKSFKTSTRLGVGEEAVQNSNLRVSKGIGGESSTTYYNFLNNGVVQPDVTGTAYYNFAQIKTGSNSGTAYTISDVEGYTATVGSGSIDADSTITSLTGFNVKNSWNAGTNNYGFRGQIASDTGRWNVYMDGTAPNYFEGDVGIGTSSPDYKLQVSDGNDTSISIKATANDTSARATRLIYSFDDGDGASINATRATSDTAADVNLSFRTGGITNSEERMRITSDGQVGIGTTVPGSSLEIRNDNTTTYDATEDGGQRANTATILVANENGTTNTFSQLVFDTAGTNQSIARIAAIRTGVSTNDLAFVVEGSNTKREALRITGAGNVGIGTTSPSTLLHTSQASGFNIFQQDSGSVINYLYADSTGKGWIGTNSNHPFVFGTNNTERARIDSSGRMLLGTPTARSNFFNTGISTGLQVEGAGSLGDPQRFLSITNNISNNGDGGPYLVLSRSKGNSISSNNIVINNDQLGAIGFLGNDGSEFVLGARIEGIVDGTPGADDMPGRLVFSTTASGATSPTERLRIDSDGNVGIGTTNPGRNLTVDGGTGTIIAAFQSTGTGCGFGLKDATTSADNTVTIRAIGNDLVSHAGGQERMRIDSSGRLLVGTSDSNNVATSSGAGFQVKQNTTITAAFYATANAAGPGGVLALGHGRSTPQGLLLEDDVLGDIRFAGGDGTDLQSIGARIRAEVDGTPGANDMPGRLIFSTTADGSSSPTERLRITSDGNVGIGTGSPTDKLHVVGSIKIEAVAPIIKLAETGVTGNPSWWIVQDAGNFSLRNNNTTPYAFSVATKGANKDTTDFVSFGGDTIDDALRLTAHGTNPTYLDLKGNNANARMRYFEGATERWNIGYDTGLNAFTFYDTQSSAIRMFLYDDPNNGIVIGADDNGNLTWPSTDGGGATAHQAALRVDGGAHAALFCYNNEQSGDPVAIFAKGNEADDNQVVIIAGDGDELEELLDIRSTTDPPNSASLLSFARDNANSKFRVYGDGRVYSSYRIGVGTTSPDSALDVLFDTSAGNRHFFFNGALGTRLQRKGDTTAWAMSYGFKSNDNTDVGGFGAFGDNTGVTRYWIGSGYTTSLFDVLPNGNVGIGTTAPGSKLEVKGNATGTAVQVEGNANSDYTYLQTRNPSGVQFQFVANANLDAQVRGVSNHPVSFYTNNTEKMRITTDGKVGIGTTDPSVPLEIVGPALKGFTQGYNIRLQDNSASAQGVGGGITFVGKWNSAVPTATADFALITGVKENNNQGDYGGALILGTRTNGTGAVNTERMRITSTGRVGIGTTSPDELLHIEGDVAEFKGTNTNSINVTGGTEQVFKFGIEGQKNGIFGPAGSIIFRQDNRTWSGVDANNKPTRIEFCTQDNITTDTSETPRLVISSDGKVGIGTTAPQAALDINAAASTSPFIASINSSEAARIDSSGRMYINNTGPLTSSPASLSKFTVTGNTIGAGNIGYINLHNLANISTNFGLGAINFAGQANNGYTGAQIFARADANWSSTSYPTSLLFYTVASGSSTLTERFRIDSAGTSTFTGNITVSNAAPLIIFSETDTTSQGRIIESAGDFYIQAGASGSGGSGSGNIRFTGYNAVDIGSLTVRTGGAYNTIWHAGNDGDGSGLDADTVDGVQLSGLIRSQTGSALGSMLTLGDQSSNYRWNNNTDGRPADAQANEFGTLLHLDYDGSRASQFAWDIQADNLYLRTLTYSTDTGTAWKKVWTDGNDGAGSGLDADTIDGIQADRIPYGSGDLGTTGTTNPGQNLRSGFFDVFGTANGAPTNSWYSYINIRHTNSTNGWGHQIAGNFYDNGELYNRHYDSGNYAGWTKIWNAANDGDGSGLDADTLDGIQSTGFLQTFYETAINSPDASGGTWTTAGSSSNWGDPKFNNSFDQYRYADGSSAYVQYNIPLGYKSCWISQLQWSSGGYADCYGVQSDGGLVFLRRINTRQQVQNSNEGDPDQHDGMTITHIGSGLEHYTAIRIQNQSGRIHLTGIAWTKNENVGYEGTGMVHPAQISHQGAGSGLDADTASIATTITISSNNDSTAYRVPYTSSNSGNVSLYVDNNDGMTYNPGTNTLSAGYFSGNGSNLTSVDADTLDTLNSTQFLRSDASGTATGFINFNGGVSVSKPSTSWTSLYYGISNIGQLYSAGSYWVSLTCNGYRNSSGTWTSHNVNNNTGASEIDLTPNGYIYFRTDSTKANGSATAPSIRAQIDPNGVMMFGPNTGWSKYLRIGNNANNSDANSASIGVTNGNLHIDAATGSYGTYLNFYDGNNGVAFGNGGGSAAVAWMGPDGDLWKGSADNSGSKYWHAGNDGDGSGLDADTLDGIQVSALAPIASPTFTGNLTIPNAILHTDDTDTYIQFHGNDLLRVVIAGAEVQEWGNNYTLLSDNDQLRLGTGSDFRMVFNGADTVFRNYAHADGDIIFQGENSAGTNQNLLIMKTDSTRTYNILYENSQERLRTTSDGVTVTGNIAVTGTVDGRDIAADGTKLDGIATGATNVTNNNQLTNGAGYITSFDITTQTDPKYLRSNAFDIFEGTTSGQYLRFQCFSGRTANSTGGGLFPLEVFQATANADAAIAFHINGDYAAYFGLDGTTNDLFWGGWSAGAAKYKVWHAANDGSGSGLDADTIDGTHLSNLMTLSGSQTVTGVKTFNDDIISTRIDADGTINTTSGGAVRAFLANQDITFTGGTNSNNVYPNAFKSTPRISATSSIGNFAHFHAQNLNISAGGSVTTNRAFDANVNLTDTATNNYAFVGRLDTGSNTNWNFYAEGTAPNYFEGDVQTNKLLVGTSNAPTGATSGTLVVEDSIQMFNSGAQDNNGRFQIYVGEQENITASTGKIQFTFSTNPTTDRTSALLKITVSWHLTNNNILNQHAIEFMAQINNNTSGVVAIGDIQPIYEYRTTVASDVTFTNLNGGQCRFDVQTALSATPNATYKVEVLCRDGKIHLSSVSKT